MDAILDFFNRWSGLLQAIAFFSAVGTYLYKNSPPGRWFRNRLAESSKQRAQKRLKDLESELRLLLLFTQQPEQLQAAMIAQLFMVAQRVIAMLLLLGVGIFQQMHELYKGATSDTTIVRDPVTLLVVVFCEYGIIFLAASALSLTAKGFADWAHTNDSKYRTELLKQFEELMQVVGVDPPSQTQVSTTTSGTQQPIDPTYSDVNTSTVDPTPASLDQTNINNRPGTS